MNKYALILTVENENSINNRRFSETNELNFRYYEKESIRCIKSWRERAGWLKDIPIYVMCPTEDIKEETKKEYQKYNVNYINQKPINFKSHEYGFTNVHYVGHHFEQLLLDTMLIHIDLDMEILRPLPEDFFDDIWNGTYKAYIGSYLQEDYKIQRKPIMCPILTNTDFVVNIAGKFNIYQEILEMLDSLDNEYSELMKKHNLRLYDKEEYSSDMMLELFLNQIKPIIGYEQGEGYFYDDTLTNVYFWHEHIKNNSDNNLSIKKIKLMKRLRNV